MKSLEKLEKQKESLNDKIEENQKKLDDLTESIKYEKAQIEIQREEYERLNKKY
jgi:chromosome segregation ATPase